MFIPTLRFVALIALFTLTIIPNTYAEGEKLSSLVNNFKGLSDFIFDTPTAAPYLMPVRPVISDLGRIERESPLSTITINDNNIGGCLKVNPYSDKLVMRQIAQSAIIMANNSANNIETLSFQPYYSGLKGQKLTIMRRDLERALITHNGSANEIYHNAVMSPPSKVTCGKPLTSEWDVELNHHIDLYDSDRTPLIRSDAIIHNRLHFGGYFIGTASTRIPLYDNLERDDNLRILDRRDPIRQDVLGFAWQGLNIERLMLSGFATPLPNLYVAGHGGYLEEKFFGLGGEFLYRPMDSAFSIGLESWATLKRTPYLGAWTTLDDANKQTSALINAWYDVPFKPFALGLSAGRFLDGDMGFQARAQYKPSQGWNFEGYTTLSNEHDRSLNSKKTNLTAGLRLTMPLGNLAYIPDNSRQLVKIEPFARDKGQRIDNAYDLRDLTDPWQTKQLYKYWDRIVEKKIPRP